MSKKQIIQISVDQDLYEALKEYKLSKNITTNSKAVISILQKDLLGKRIQQRKGVFSTNVKVNREVLQDYRQSKSYMPRQSFGERIIPIVKDMLKEYILIGGQIQDYLPFDPKEELSESFSIKVGWDLYQDIVEISNMLEASFNQTVNYLMLESNSRGSAQGISDRDGIKVYNLEEIEKVFT